MCVCVCVCVCVMRGRVDLPVSIVLMDIPAHWQPILRTQTAN